VSFLLAVSYTTVQCRIRKYFRASWLGLLGPRAPLHCRVCRGGSYATARDVWCLFSKASSTE